MKLHHGGRLRAAAEHYGIALADWLDLSTAINPQAWPVPEIPVDVWQRLPEEDDGLACNAAHYYGRAELSGDSVAERIAGQTAKDAPHCTRYTTDKGFGAHDRHPILPVPGTQSVIETLPRLFLPRRVWVPAIGYQEHAYCWRKHRHELIPYSRLPTADRLQPHDVVIVINPNNPTAQRQSPESLRSLALAVASQKGLLIVDEAFMDCTPTDSLLTAMLPPATLVMRSFGKFFGLAGIRLGFCFASPTLLQRLEEAMGTWAINHPARWIAQRALRDGAWQQQARTQLQATSDRIRSSLQAALEKVLSNPVEVHATALFVTCSLGADTAASFYDHCARQGILVRLFADEGLVRVGLGPGRDAELRLLEVASTFVGCAAL